MAPSPCQDQPGICPPRRKLNEPSEDLEELLDSDEEGAEGQVEKSREDDPEGYLDADLNTLTPVQRLLRSKRAKGRRLAWQQL